MNEDPSAIMAEARAKLGELREVADAAVSRARAVLSGGSTLGRPELKALTRAASLARYVADCAHRASCDPPRRRRFGPSGRFAIPPPQQLDPHAAHAVELLKHAPLAAMPLSPAISAWVESVRNWLGIGAIASMQPERKPRRSRWGQAPEEK